MELTLEPLFGKLGWEGAVTQTELRTGRRSHVERPTSEGPARVCVAECGGGLSRAWAVRVTLEDSNARKEAFLFLSYGLTSSETVEAKAYLEL